MQLQTLVGSILSLKIEPITNSDLIVIKKCLEKENIDLISSIDVSSVVYELRNYDNYFSLSVNKIGISKNYENNTIALKRRFFDSLEQKDKSIIYDILNQIL